MSIVAFGMRCDVCALTFNDYDCGTIRTCEDCLIDYCPACAKASGHVEGRELDMDQPATWREPETVEVVMASVPNGETW